jgi:hypothetical protein
MLRLRTTTIAALSALALALTFVGTAGASPGFDSRDGACTGAEGVTVVVDTGTTVAVRCVFGTPATGLDALERAYAVVTISTGWGPQVCQVAGAGTADCSSTDTWVYWQPDGAGWTTASSGADSTIPKPGDVDGWRLIPDYNAWPGDAPRVAPRAVTITSSPTGSVPSGQNVTIGFSVPDAGTSTLCRIDLGTWTSCTTTATHVVTAPAPGTHTVTVRAVDFASNVSLVSTSFTVIPAPASIASSSATVSGPHAATVAARVSAGGSAQQVHVELTDRTDAEAVRTASQGVASGATTDLSFSLRSLAADTTFRYRVVTVGDAGTVTGAWSTLKTQQASLAAGVLDVTTSSSFVRAGTSVRVNVNGLAASEQFAIRMRRMNVATGTADASGAAVVSVAIAADAPRGRSALIVTGSRQDRAARALVTVTRAQKLGVTPSRRAARAGSTITLTTSGLVAGESVTVRRGATIIARGTADQRGRYSTRVAVGRSAGRLVLRVTGSHASRRGAAVVHVVRGMRRK